MDVGDPQLTAMMNRGRISPARGMEGPMLARREMRAKQGPCRVRGRQGPVYRELTMRQVSLAIEDSACDAIEAATSGLRPPKPLTLR